MSPTQRLPFIVDRLDEFVLWQAETASPDCDPREAHLVDCHNRLLRAVKQVREIASEVKP